MQDGNEPAARGAVRLIFERNGDALRLVLQQPVDVTVTRFDVQADVRPGHYVEIRDAAGMTLSRAPVRSAFTSIHAVADTPDLTRRAARRRARRSRTTP